MKKRTMGFQIRKREPVDVAIKRIVLEEIRGSISDVVLRQPNAHEAVHDFRKRCKKVRGALRLIRPHLGERFRVENDFFRDLSRELSFVRDAQALIEALDRLLAHYVAEIDASAAHDIRERLIEARERAAGGDAALESRLEAMVEPLEAAARRVTEWELPDRGFDTLAPGLCLTYRRARRAMQAAYETPAAPLFHEWRKRVKYHWHHSLLLKKICPRYLKPQIKFADTLGELLGEDHDYAVLQQWLLCPADGQPTTPTPTWLVDLIARRQQELRGEMYHLGRYLQAETPRRLAARWGSYWRTWRRENGLDRIPS